MVLIIFRLLFLQVSRMISCKADESAVWSKTKSYCSSILKEARTNERLGFPERDIFLEQGTYRKTNPTCIYLFWVVVVLCGLEGVSEFLIAKWQEEIVRWQTPQGCYQPHVNLIRKYVCKRTSNFVAFGCTDHTTGLGVAALSLSLRYNLSKNYK